MNIFGEEWNIFLIEDGVDNIQVIQLLLEAMGNKLDFIHCQAA